MTNKERIDNLTEEVKSLCKCNAEILKQLVDVACENAKLRVEVEGLKGKEECLYKMINEVDNYCNKSVDRITEEIVSIEENMEKINNSVKNNVFLSDFTE